MPELRKTPMAARANAAAVSPADLDVLRRKLVRWYRAHRRDLPWRRTRDPYRIWISEIMLQQTRVESALPYYERFVRLFPDVESLARAPLERVLHTWSGLGYYTRARNLHATARRIVEAHAGRFPEEAARVAALPGVGPYTSGAIRSIAFGQPAPILDGNVVRVFARLFALEGDLESAAGRQVLWSIAASWAHCRAPGDANQALMELGATRCTKPVPDCAHCPLESNCAAHRRGLERELPRPRRRRAAEVVGLSAALVTRGTRLLLVRRASGKLLRDWWEVPVCASGGDGIGAERTLSRALETRCGVFAGSLRHAGQVHHGILHHRLEVEVFQAARSVRAPRAARSPHGMLVRETASVDRAPDDAARGGFQRPARSPARRATALANLDLDDLEIRWAEPGECRALPLSTLTLKALREAARVDSRWAEYAHREPAQKPRRERRRDPARDDL